MAGADSADQHALAAGRNELALRVCSALVLASLALGVAYAGGWLFFAFWSLAAVIVLGEWTTVVAKPDHRLALMLGLPAFSIALALVALDRCLAALVVLALGTACGMALAPAGRRTWVAAGFPYAAALALAPLLLRSDARDGFTAIMFLFAIVWATDIGAYFVGRAAGGPKLMPSISPRKTWAGAIGGILAALVVSIPFAGIGAPPTLVATAVLAAVLSIVAQLGDLLESALKRRFGAKDSSKLIPGHGGVMDRLDGFVSAAAVAALLGLARGGLDAPAHGLLAW